MSSAPLPFWVAQVRTSYDSIGWAGLPHDPKYGCIHPPPFGKQCTLLREDALFACLKMPGCAALTCPDPSESWIGRKPGITGPICQARRNGVPKERNHGMCKPGGCINIALRPAPLNRSGQDWATRVAHTVPTNVQPHVAIIRFRAPENLSHALEHLLPDLPSTGRPRSFAADMTRSAAVRSWELVASLHASGYNAKGTQQSVVAALDLSVPPV